MLRRHCLRSLRANVLHHRPNVNVAIWLLPLGLPSSIVHHRGKRTKTKVRLSDLPQGVIPSEPLPELPDLRDEPAYPTVVLQARRNMQKFNNCVLLTRVGGFYELYFEHAEEYGPLLNLKVASKKTSAGPVPMVSRHPDTTVTCV